MLEQLLGLDLWQDKPARRIEIQIPSQDLCFRCVDTSRKASASVTFLEDMGVTPVLNTQRA